MSISLVMATAGRKDEIFRLLDSLERQTSLAYELIIVDQNQDGLLDPVLQRLKFSTLCYKHIVAAKKGLSISRNIAFPYTKHEIIGYPDDDCWYEEGVIEGVINFFDKNPDVDGLVGRWCEKDINFNKEFLLNQEQLRQFHTGISGSSICLFMRRKLVEKVSGFDERLGVPQWYGSGEETDFLIRCLVLGARIRYAPNVRIHHQVKSTRDGGIKKVLSQARNRSRGTGAIYRKHRLSLVVITRGLASPIVKSFLPPYSFRKILANIMMFLGRIEGMLFWKSGSGNQRNNIRSL